METRKIVMDRWTAEHFDAWMDNNVSEDQQHEVEQQIHALLAEYPELLEAHSWTDMRALAERFGG